MKWQVPPVSILKKFMMASACVAVCAWCAPVSLAQRVGGHVGGGGGGVRMAVPRPVGVPRPAGRPMARPPMAARPLVPAGGPRGVGRPIGGFRHPFIFGAPFFFGSPFFGPPFFGPPFFGYGVNVAYDSLFWLTCGPLWSWEAGCGGAAAAEPPGGYPNYVTAPVYESPVYVYGMERPDYVKLFLKDGTVFNVSDYWFVNGQVHFITEEEDTEPIEQMVNRDEVDWQKTIDVNKRRGFRLVMRDEPWRQYLRDHPNETPPEVQPPEKQQ